tara:strand:+ start:1871 stop:2062 length:192 start_codon:yes stop_codon:yes gene_type:complete
MINEIIGIRYFKTARGVGYEAKTDIGSIWNDGDGGATYHEPHVDLSEDELERLIDVFERMNDF